MQAKAGALMQSGRITLAILVTAVALSACSRKSTGDPGPDEFSVLPVSALSEPPSYNDLPAPRADGASRAETNPVARAMALLGGDPSRQPRMLGSIETAGTGVFGGLFRRKSAQGILDTSAESQRLLSLGIPVVTGN